jgi:hypothetical protein
LPAVRQRRSFVPRKMALLSEENVEIDRRFHVGAIKST